jgi:hypothetical protein
MSGGRRHEGRRAMGFRERQLLENADMQRGYLGKEYRSIAE